MSRWCYIKLMSFPIATEAVNKIERPPVEWEKVFPNYIFDKGIKSKIYKKLRQLDSNKSNNMTAKWAKDLN